MELYMQFEKLMTLYLFDQKKIQYKVRIKMMGILCKPASNFTHVGDGLEAM